MRISDWSSDVCSSDLSWGAPFAWAGFAPHYPGNQMRGGGFDLLGRRSAPCSPTTGGIVLPAKLICLLPLLACAAACSEDGLTQAGSAMEPGDLAIRDELRSEEHTSELQSLMRISYAVFCLKTKKTTKNT